MGQGRFSFFTPPCLPLASLDKALGDIPQTIEFKAFELLVQHGEGKPALVFCP